LHDRDIERLRSIIRFRLRDNENMTVFCDLKMDWGIDDLPNPVPDVSVIENVRDPERPRGVFYVAEEGVTPCFVLEVVSPRYRSADLDKKPEIYRKAGVSEYFIVDPGLMDDEISYSIRGYKLIGNRYVGATPDSQGMFHSRIAGVRIGVSESGNRLIVTDDRTGEELMSDKERAETAEERAETAEERAETAEERAETAEERAKQESKARQTAERAVRAERKKAEAEREKARKLAEKLRALGIDPESL